MSEWQPIETAPKDRVILGYVQSADWENEMIRGLVDHGFVAEVWWLSDGWEVQGFGSWVYPQVTHWMPLPNPPQS